MSKDPAFLFYSGDFICGTLTMTDRQVGQYIRLMCLQHQQGHLSESKMLAICKKPDPVIWGKFVQDENGNYYNERLEDEVDKRFRHCDKQRENVLKRWGKNDTNESENSEVGIGVGNTAVLPLEDVNERERYNVKRKIERGYGGEEENPLEKAIDDFKDFRKSMKSPMSSKAVELLKTKLNKLADNDELKIAILEQSILRGWKGIFEIKDEQKSKGNRQYQTAAEYTETQKTSVRHSDLDLLEAGLK